MPAGGMEVLLKQILLELVPPLPEVAPLIDKVSTLQFTD
jgi:hypothetical protein